VKESLDRQTARGEGEKGSEGCLDREGSGDHKLRGGSLSTQGRRQRAKVTIAMIGGYVA
jgi:hypothetical protein